MTAAQKRDRERRDRRAWPSLPCVLPVGNWITVATTMMDDLPVHE